MFYRFYFLVILVLPLFLSAQNVNGEIKKQIAEKRNALKELILNQKIDSVQIDFLYVENLYSIVDPFETESLYLLTNSYNKFITVCNIYVSGFTTREEYDVCREEFKAKFKYSKRYNDSLTIAINNLLIQSKNKLQQNIERSNLSAEEKDIMKLVLLYKILCADFTNLEIDDELLHETIAFLKKYPSTKYSKFTDYYNVEYKETKWGYGGYYNTGAIIPMGGISNFFTTQFVVINEGIHMNYKRVYIQGGIGASFVREIKEDVYFQKQWNENDQFDYFYLELMVGYNLIDRKRLAITPIVGIKRIDICPYSPNNSEYYNDVDDLISNSLSLGVNIDLKWGYNFFQKKNKRIRGGSKMKQYMFSRISLGYSNTQFDKEVNGLDGGLWIANFGIGYHFQKRKKIKGGQ